MSPSTGAGTLEPTSVRGDAPDRASWPCTTCGTDNPLVAPVCSACGAGFLAQLRDKEPPLLELPVVGDISKLSRMQGISLAAAVIGAVLLVVFLLGVLTA